MPWRRCFVRGENFPLKLLGHGREMSSGRVGFYTTRWIEAASPADAEARCVELLKQDPALAHDQIEEFTPMIYVEKIDELIDEPDEHPGTGFTFFKN